MLVKIKKNTDGKIESIILNPNPCENCAFKNKCEKYKECQEREKLNYEAKDIMQRQRAEINKLKEQLEVATKALKEYADSENWIDAYCDDGNYDVLYVKGLLNNFGYETAENALNKIKQIGESK